MNSSLTMLSFRIERNNEGPFYNHEHMKELIKQAKKVTPNWLQDEYLQYTPTFAQFYIYNGLNSEVDEKFLERTGYHLSQLWDMSYRHGFRNKEAMISEFGLAARDEYKNQFAQLLDKKVFDVKVRLVKPIDFTDREVFYSDVNSEIIEVADNYSSFMRL